MQLEDETAALPQISEQEGRSPRNKRILGQNFLFTPTVIDDIHIKAELGRYRMRGMAIFKPIPSWDDLTFLPGTLTRFVIEGACPRRHDGRHRYLLGRRRHDPGRTPLLRALALSMHPVTLRIQPAPSPAGGRL